MEQIEGALVYKTEGEIVIVGRVATENETYSSHSCDKMGCSSVAGHVLYCFTLPGPPYVCTLCKVSLYYKQSHNPHGQKLCEECYPLHIRSCEECKTAWKEELREQREEALAEIARISQEYGLYD